MKKASQTVRVLFLNIAVFNLIGIGVTGSGEVHGWSYVVPALLLFAAASGICPGCIRYRRSLARTESHEARSPLSASAAPTGTKHHRPGGRSRRAWALGAGLGLLLAVIAPAWGGELVHVQADERGGEYHIRMEQMVDADPALVHGVLTDYLHVYRLNPSIIQSATSPSPDGIDGVRVKTRVQTGMAFLRVALVSVADVRELPSGDLQATVVPELSDFRHGSARWQIHPAGGGSRVVYEASMAPRRFIPPLIGTRIVLRKLISETAVTFARLECLARARGYLASGKRAQNAFSPAGTDCCEQS